MSKLTLSAAKAMETAGFGESFEERIFFTGVASVADPTCFTRLQSRKAALALMRRFVARGNESEAHCERVATWSRRLSQELGLSSERVLDVEIGALLHDIGHACLPAVTFDAPNPSSEDLLEMRKHCEFGAQMLRGIPSLRRAIPLVSSHHEHFDGGGYPAAAQGVAIPIDGRIFHLVDAFETLTTSRPYRRLSDAEARAEIAKVVGSRFDPVVYAAFCRIDPEEWRVLVPRV